MIDLRKYIIDRRQDRVIDLLTEIYKKSKDPEFRTLFDNLGMRIGEISGFLSDVGWTLGAYMIAGNELLDLLDRGNEIYALDPVIKGYLNCFFQAENIAWACAVDRTVEIVDRVLLNSFMDGFEGAQPDEFNAAMRTAAEDFREHYQVPDGMTLSEKWKVDSPEFDPDCDDSFGGLMLMRIKDEDELIVEDVMKSLCFGKTEDPVQYYNFSVESYDNSCLLETYMFEQMGIWLSFLAGNAEDVVTDVSPSAMAVFTRIERLMEYPDVNHNISRLISYVADYHFTETQVMI